MPFTAYRCWDWEFDGAAVEWTKLENVDPHPGFGTATPAIVYDLSRNVVVGETGVGYTLNVPDRAGDPTEILGRTAPATMERDTSAEWAAVSAVQPTGLSNLFDMGFDEANGETVLVRSTNETWKKSSGDWTLQSPTHPAIGNTQVQTFPSKMVFDQNRGKLVMLSFSGIAGVDKIKVKEWDGTDWTQFSAGSAPLTTSDNYAFSCGYDSTHAKVVYFNWFNGETWTRSGTTWTQRTPTHSPATGSGKLCYLCDDPNSGGLILQQAVSGFPHLWLWDDTDWTEITPGSQPSLVDGVQTHLVWAPDRSRVFGTGSIESYDIRGRLNFAFGVR